MDTTEPTDRTEPTAIRVTAPDRPAAPRKLPTRSEVMERRREEHDGIDFEFKATMAGFVGKARRLPLNDRASYGIMPTAIQDRVIFLLNKGRSRNDTPGTPLTLKRQIEDVAGNEDLANAYCLASVVEPRLTDDPAAVDEDAGVWHVEDLHILDRVAVMNWNLGNDETAGDRVKAFRYVPGGPLVRVAAPAGDRGGAE